MFLSKDILEKGAMMLNNDLSIDDDSFEVYYQHVRDDMQFFASFGGVDSSELGMHKDAIVRLLKKYGLI